MNASKISLWTRRGENLRLSIPAGGKAQNNGMEGGVMEAPGVLTQAQVRVGRLGLESDMERVPAGPGSRNPKPLANSHRGSCFHKHHPCGESQLRSTTQPWRGNSKGGQRQICAQQWWTDRPGKATLEGRQLSLALKASINQASIRTF